MQKKRYSINHVQIQNDGWNILYNVKISKDMDTIRP